MRTSIALLLLPLLAAASPARQRKYSVFTSTLNQLTDGTPCRDLTIIFARGTFEIGNVGTVTGPAFFQAVADRIGQNRVAVQGVDYPADVPGFFAGGDANGSDKLAGLIALASTQCPNTKLCISGYSQGAQLVHNAAKELTDEQTAFVNSVMLFGDPDKNQPVDQIPAEYVHTECQSDDDICNGGNNFLGAHLTYGFPAGAAEAADFVVKRSGL